MKTQLSDHFSYKKLLKAVFPTICMMVFCSIYSIVDGIFVSNVVGESAFVGVNLVFPVLMVIGAVGFMFGAGGSALAAKTYGEGDKEGAQRIFSLIVVTTAIVGLVISAVVFLLLDKIVLALAEENTTQQTLDNAVLYGRVLLCFMVMFMVQNVFQSFFVMAEKATTGFIVTVIAGCTNMVLDALFVALFRWGIVGAAIATGISQTVGAVIPLVYFSRKSNDSILRLVKPRLMVRALVKSATNGSSELLSNVSMSVVSMLFNKQLLKFAGEQGVAAYGVIMYAGFIFCAIFIGYSIGMAPIVSYHFGAKNTDEVKSILKKSLVITALFSVAMVTLTEIFARPLGAIFVSYNKELLDLTARGFQLYGLCFGLCGFGIFASGFFTALNDGLVSALISFSRTLVFPILFVFLLPLWWGVDGIWLSVVIAEACSTVVSVAFFLANKSKYKY